MKQFVYLTLVAGCILAFPTLGKTPLVRPAGESRRTTTTAENVDPDAMAALNRMGVYPRTLKAFQIRSVTRREDCHGRRRKDRVRRRG